MLKPHETGYRGTPYPEDEREQAEEDRAWGGPWTCPQCSERPTFVRNGPCPSCIDAERELSGEAGPDA